MTIGGTAIVCQKGNVGVGAKPGEMGVVLIGASADPTFHKRGEKSIGREGARTEADLAKLPGYVEVAGTGDLVTSMEMGDCRLHVEWFSPPGGEGQLAGNSGVYVQSLYEVQILGTLRADMLGRPEQEDGAGAIYKVKTPDVNASTGPGTWQAYDIWFKAPRFEGGKKTSDARMTVYWNGVLVHNDAAIPGPTVAAAGGESAGRPVQIGPLRLQDHDSKAEGSVRFRNVWVAPLREVKYVAAGDWEKPLEKVGADGLPEGWSPRGGKAEFRVEKGVVIGSSRPHTGNTFLVSAKEYADFEMEIDYEDNPELNSGVQIRSSVPRRVREAGRRGVRAAGGDRSERSGVLGGDVRRAAPRLADHADGCAGGAGGVSQDRDESSACGGGGPGDPDVAERRGGVERV